MNVPLLDLKAQFQPLRAEIMAEVQTVCDEQGFILGPRVVAFEESVARYIGSRYAIGCASGSDALLLSLMAMGVKAGDEVITVPFTFFATAGAISRLGAKPVFVDIQPDTFNIDPSLIETSDHASHESHHSRSPLRAMCGHGCDQRDCRTKEREGD